MIIFHKPNNFVENYTRKVYFFIKNDKFLIFQYNERQTDDKFKRTIPNFIINNKNKLTKNTGSDIFFRDFVKSFNFKLFWQSYIIIDETKILQKEFIFENQNLNLNKIDRNIFRKSKFVSSKEFQNMNINFEEDKLLVQKVFWI